MPKKNRISIPDDVSAKVLFLSDRTCCVCNEKGKNVQIHHIDENPSNNNPENLSVLCLECHNDTMIKGGFGRKLTAAQVILYRDEWLSRVKSRKEKADETASIQTITGSTETNIVVIAEGNFELEFEANKDPQLLKQYLTNILPVHNAQLIISRSKWDSGITTKMNEGNSDLIDFYEEVLSELATFFPPGQFQNKSPEHFFNELIANKFTWYWAMNEPYGLGTGGTMASTISGGNVISDLQGMIIEMITTLIETYNLESEFEETDWRKEWKNEYR